MTKTTEQDDLNAQLRDHTRIVKDLQRKVPVPSLFLARVLRLEGNAATEAGGPYVVDAVQLDDDYFDGFIPAADDVVASSIISFLIECLKVSRDNFFLAFERLAAGESLEDLQEEAREGTKNADEEDVGADEEDAP